MNYKDFFDKLEDSLEGSAHLDELANANHDPFRILISTIISARTRDQNTRKVTKRLFTKYKTPQDIANLSEEELQDLIYEAGFYRAKAKHIKETSQIIHEKYDGKVPRDFDKLIELPGVGRKTANCTLAYAFQIPAICVDTHVYRISNRLGWTKSKNPKQTEKKLKQLIPKDQWIRINRLFVKFGQQICLPNNPKHEICPVEDICPKNFSMEQK
ncbi:MAG: Endonuclease III [Promethearchaeota archaeon]|jgi:endonuclease-3|nr:MAG: Endonuclease III [Candidatus Lokiarchaeota archaeon]